jgi:hypothetical protein
LIKPWAIFKQKNLSKGRGVPNFGLKKENSLKSKETGRRFPINNHKRWPFWANIVFLGGLPCFQDENLGPIQAFLSLITKIEATTPSISSSMPRNISLKAASNDPLFVRIFLFKNEAVLG